MTSAMRSQRPDVPRAVLGRWTGRQLDPRRNSLNIIRLVLALCVLYFHSWPLGGFAGSPTIAGVPLGAWAVDAFFCISGYLITGSRLSKPLGPYLVHRVARIYPAFWICMLTIALVFAPIDYVRSHGSLDGYFTAPGVTPVNFLFLNASLRIGSYGIADTLTTTPYPVAWDGSVWSLYYEFICYLVVGFLGSFMWWRRSAVAATLAFGLSVLAASHAQSLAPILGANPEALALIELLPFFLGGALVQMLRRRLPLHWTGAALALGVTGVSVATSTTWGPQFAAPFITYFLLWAGTALPSSPFLRRHDISYGVYIYAFPVQQLLSSFGANRHGVFAYTALAVLGTIPLAAASWLLIERPVMRRAKRTERLSLGAGDAVEPSTPAHDRATIPANATT